jgi:hypothetical protein
MEGLGVREIEGAAYAKKPRKAWQKNSFDYINDEK